MNLRVTDAQTGTQLRGRRKAVQTELPLGFDLQNQRREALSRVRGALEEMLIILEQSPVGSPAHGRVAACIKGLRRTEATLEAGIVPAND